jgi:hypothetical protein
VTLLSFVPLTRAGSLQQIAREVIEDELDVSQFLKVLRSTHAGSLARVGFGKMALGER